MKKSTLLAAASVLLATIGTLVFASSLGESIVPEVHADDSDKGCTVAGAAGTYGFLASGTVIGVGPVAATGLLTADRAGNLVVNETINLNGSTFPETVTGTLNVNSDCTFTDSFSDGTTASGVIVEGGREVDFVETVPGETISGTAKRRD